MATRSIEGLEALLRELDVGVPIPTFVKSDTLRKPIDIYRSYLADMASKTLGCDAGLAYEAIRNANYMKDNSDLTLILPKLKLGGSGSGDLAKEALMKFSSTPLFQLPVADGMYLRFFFSGLALPQLILSYVNDRMEYYGQGGLLQENSIPLTKGGTGNVIIEFSSPNIVTKSNSYHLRGAILVAQIARLYESMGCNVVRLNFLGDWGKEIGLLSVGWRKFGSEEAFRENPMGHLHDIYERANEQFKPEKEASRKARDEGLDTAKIKSQGIYAERDSFSKRMEDGESGKIGSWARMRDVSIAYYTHAYKRLSINFDEFSSESQVSQESIMEVESVLRERGIYEERNGSWIIDYSKHGPKGLGVSVLRSHTGSTSHLLRDIAAVLDRKKKYSFDKMIYVVAAGQDVHFRKVFQALRYMGHEDLAAKLEHVNFKADRGRARQLDGAHFPGEILDQSVRHILQVLRSDANDYAEIEKNENSAEILAVTSLITQFCGLSRRAGSYSLNAGRFISFKGNTGPNLQLCYAKLRAKINKSNPKGTTLTSINYTYLKDDPWAEVIRVMAQYPDAVDAAIRRHEPSMVLAYLYRLAEEVRNCLEEEDDDDGGNEEGKRGSEEPSEALLAQAILYRYAQQVLENGMVILGITPISR
ncbi:arginyl-tRNA synthetase [Annulohypoxylon moriforme]|nr:arginyl-tRNA synthetase [Annulohypoxylon moriforme]